MRAIKHTRSLTLVGLLIAPGLGFSQADQQRGTLIVKGHSGQAEVTQINGRSYVAVDALARLMHGSLGYRGNQITLTLPAAAGGTGTALPAGQPANLRFSKDFLNASIETLSDIRGWRSAVLNAVENGYPVKDDWMANYRAQAVKNLHLASVAATTESDHNGFQLLRKECDHMQELSDKILATRKKLSYITPDIMKKDPLDQKILNCARSLAAMAASGEFQDNGSCN